MAELGEANIGGRLVPAWVLESTAEEIDNGIKSINSFSRPNLLDNWYFVDPINQRQGYIKQNAGGMWVACASTDEGAVRGYANTGYTIDRWKFAHSGASLIVNDGYCTIHGYRPLCIGVEDTSFLEGREVTISILTKKKLNVFHVTWTTKDNSSIVLGRIDDTRRFLYVYSGKSIFMGHPCLVVGYDSTPEGSPDIDLLAAKFELGGQQTLAHQDASGNWVLNEIPNRGEQLARCQRYFQTFKTQSLRPTDYRDFRPVMRTNPVLSTITVGSDTLYTASADL